MRSEIPTRTRSLAPSTGQPASNTILSDGASAGRSEEAIPRLPLGFHCRRTLDPLLARNGDAPSLHRVAYAHETPRTRALGRYTRTALWHCDPSLSQNQHHVSAQAQAPVQPPRAGGRAHTGASPRAAKGHVHLTRSCARASEGLRKESAEALRKACILREQEVRKRHA